MVFCGFLCWQRVPEDLQTYQDLRLNLDKSYWRSITEAGIWSQEKSKKMHSGAQALAHAPARQLVIKRRPKYERLEGGKNTIQVTREVGDQPVHAALQQGVIPHFALHEFVDANPRTEDINHRNERGRRYIHVTCHILIITFMFYTTMPAGKNQSGAHGRS